ncbi:acyltransferase [Subsaximicrobium wynnwilliamsii]|uniref:Acyltransferase n=1 Tax=Subsaximicrobium wynnwilliamsii TaxID=291179 RepID=A0A5C6ZG43_9FLAO|nr:acyltransferase [Subsaximicrobium wynnwilliamsii]TXD81362.1 acyltransferase [Subsaximicrobium wynnwilliamsii]TXD89058.1 acyltransferase [Subsaximicrobium wynnwilliamsii]TXE00736.1 acyltransferase [Subsaximicrobium wynnwilliamsii]
MTIILSYIKYWVNSFIRNLYWLYRLMNVKFDRNSNLSFPIIVEGRGKIAFGEYAQVQKGVNLGVGDNGSLVIGNECKLEKDALIRVGADKNFKIGHKFHLGHGVRLYVQDDWEFHNHTSIHSLCSISSREPGLAGKFIMHDNSHIGDNCIIDVSDDITIMENVAIGPNCTFYSHDHKYEDFSKAAWAGKTYTAKIFIGKNSWIGSNVTILPGVTIGSHVVVAAGSVVTKDLEDNSVYAGVPAKKMKTIE